MRTLIVGCGYLGLRLGRRLADQGERVFGTVRTPQSAERLSRVGITAVIADVLVPESLESLPETDRVFYGVGFDRASGIAMRTVYVEGLRNVLRRLSTRRPKLVYASSTGVYGGNDGGWVTESEPPCPTSESGRVCLEAEEVIRGGTADPGERPVILRFSGLYGPGRIPGRASLERGEPIVGSPEKTLNLIHIDDAARAAAAALERGEAGSIYLASDDRPVSRREYYGALAGLVGAPLPRFEAPVPGSPAAFREESNKRISNRRMRTELGVVLAFPEITTGLPAALTGA